MAWCLKNSFTQNFIYLVLLILPKQPKTKTKIKRSIRFAVAGEYLREIMHMSYLCINELLFVLPLCFVYICFFLALIQMKNEATTTDKKSKKKKIMFFGFLSFFFFLSYFVKPTSMLLMLIYCCIKRSIRTRVHNPVLYTWVELIFFSLFALLRVFLSFCFFHLFFLFCSVFIIYLSTNNA